MLPHRLVIMIYSHQELHINSTNILISSADNKGQLRTPSLTNNNSSKSNIEALCCVEISEITWCKPCFLVTDRISVTSEREQQKKHFDPNESLYDHSKYHNGQQYVLYYFTVVKNKQNRYHNSRLFLIIAQ